MNYQKIYNTLIKRGHQRTDIEGLDKHRVIPGYQNGTYEPSNVAFLTRREHRLAHVLMYRIHGNWQDYQAARVLGQKNYEGPWNKGKKFPDFHTEESKEKLRLANLGSYEERYGVEVAEKMRKQRSEKFTETRKRIDPWNKGKKCPYVSEMSKNRVCTDETRERMRQNKLGRQWWNNGSETRLAHEQPGPDWVVGRGKLKQ